MTLETLKEKISDCYSCKRHINILGAEDLRHAFKLDLTDELIGQACPKHRPILESMVKIILHLIFVIRLLMMTFGLQWLVV